MLFLLNIEGRATAQVVSADISHWNTGFDARAIHVGFVMKKSGLGASFSQVTLGSPVNIASPVLHTHTHTHTHTEQ
jgi:hypothetical protein